MPRSRSVVPEPRAVLARVDEQPIRIADSVSEAIRVAVAVGDLRTGDAVREEEWAHRLGVSRTPVREAIGRLVTEGLLNKRGRTAYVFQPSFSDILEIYDIRLELERLGAQRAAANADAAVARQLAKLLKAMDASTDPGAWFSAHERFHMTLLEASKMPRLCTIIELLRRQSEPYVRFAVNVDTEFRANSRAHHHDLAEAIRKRDVANMDRLVVVHLEATRREVTKLLSHGWASVVASASVAVEPGVDA